MSPSPSGPKNKPSKEPDSSRKQEEISSNYMKSKIKAIISIICNITNKELGYVSQYSDKPWAGWLGFNSWQG
jgi:hypothetical protein